MFVGVLGAVLLGGMLMTFAIYSMLWIESRQRRGVEDKDIPIGYYLSIIVPLLIGAGCLWITFYGHH